MTKGKKIEVFCDFDGTITKEDIGDKLFKVFGEFQPWNRKLIEREIDISEYWHILCRSLGSFEPEKVRSFALEQEVDAYFRPFAEWCEESGLNMRIVSDGFGSYIRPILEREGLGHLPVYCNEMVFSGSNVLPVFPGASESCECFCASCKRNTVLTKAEPDSVLVFIGDGYSDYCAAEHCDIIFAKKNLAAYCNEHRIPHYPFHTFFEVKKLLKKLIENNNYKTNSLDQDEVCHN
ncbi:MAG: MtnX-like HAD-IB family phosphatase [Bacteroidota bacterium]